jgi:hypothetical protein
MLKSNENAPARARFEPHHKAPVLSIPSRRVQIERRLRRVAWVSFKEDNVVLKGVMGQLVGIISIPLWLGGSVYFMARAADPTATDTGNWFAAFIVATIVFVGLMSFWNKIFRDEA